MSLVRARAGRGTWASSWRTIATLAIALSFPATAFAAVIELPRAASASRQAPATPEPKAPPKAKERRTQRKKRKPTIEDMIRSQFGKRADEALNVARCESKLQPKALSRSGARGIFQIMPVHSWRIARVRGKDLWDPKTNIKVARHLFDDEGWGPWSCARIVGLR
jgi:soluble lytic murein transglycosylase-like protein